MNFKIFNIFESIKIDDKGLSYVLLDILFVLGLISSTVVCMQWNPKIGFYQSYKNQNISRIKDRILKLKIPKCR